MNYLLKTIMRNLNFLNSDNDNHKSLRVRTNIGDTFLNVNLDQTYESLDILSLKIYQADVYRLFDADYGIIVGRVTGQDVGIPNCRISVFIPTDEESITGPTQLDDIKKIEAAALYPYKTVFDKDGNAKIYNLLPKYRRFRGLNGFPANENGIGATPATPVGTFPEKEEILSNESVAYVYDKYYKFSTFTNESGDYILVVPANRTYTVNMSCDITDIGKFSTTPALLKSENSLPNSYFIETNGVVNINPEIPLEKLPNIDIQNQSVYVKSLWSQNPDNTNIGINRLDFRIQKKLQPYVTVFGNYMSHNKDHWWRAPYQDIGAANDALAYDGSTNPNDIKIGNLQTGNLVLRVFSIKNTVSEYDADLLNSGTILSNYDYNTDIELLPQSKYIFRQDNGNAYIAISCNRNKVITNEFGELISVADDNEAGAFTSFRGYFMLENENGNNNPDGTLRTGKIRLKVPQLRDYSTGNENFVWDTTYSTYYRNAFQTGNSEKWIWAHYKFDYGELYSWSQYSDVAGYNREPQDEWDDTQTNILYFGERKFYFPNNDRNFYKNKHPNSNTLNTYGGEGQAYINFYNHLKEGTQNESRMIFVIKKQWINFSLFFVNFAYNADEFALLSADIHIMMHNRLKGNAFGTKDAPIGANQTLGEPGGTGTNNENGFLPNGESIKTNFFKVNKEDLLKFYDFKINNNRQHGFRIPKAELKGEYFRYNHSNYFANIGGDSLDFINQDNGDIVGERYFLLGRPANHCVDYLLNFL
jgi:hypothetical protein